ncbi:MAG: TIR domain-containing protein, partial [Verrucomicrobia bacterium]|nr:TIR domain-containing protein [Verrucomicrobiota bacterium]
MNPSEPANEIVAMSEKIKTYKYFAFISYSRKDSKAAAWLQKRLEWFRFPVKLVPQDRRPPHERYVRPIYRDKTHLEVTDEHYWTNIKKALEESRYLIVLCSPHSAGSAPVNLEVDHFLETHDNDTSFIAPVIVGGSVTGDGDNAVLCPALHSLGESLIDRNLPTMVPDPGTAEQDAWEQGFVSLVSYLLSLERTTLGDHIQRETQRQARALRRWLTAVILLTFIAATVAGIAWQQRNRALSAEATSAQEAKRRKTLLEESSRADHEAARKLLDNGGWRGAVAHLDRALRFNPDNREAASHLWHIISYGSGTDGDRDMLPRRHFKHPRLVAGVWFAANDTRLVTLCDDGSVRLWALSDGRHEAVLSAGSVTALAVSPHGNLVAMGDLKGEITLCSAVDGRVVAKVKAHSQAIRSVAFDSEGTRLATA